MVWRARPVGRRSRRSLLAAVALCLLTSACSYDIAVRHEQTSPGTRPWFCNATGDGTPLSGHGNGHQVDPHYAGMTKGPLSWDDCKALARQLDAAVRYALQWPTRGQAEANGWSQIAQYIPGLGTHHMRGGLAAPFDPVAPVFLIYGGRGADAPLMGLAYSSGASGAPPEGFAGGNDWYHHHPTVCIGNGILAGAEVVSDSECRALGGSNIPINLYLLHLWIIPGREYRPDLFISGHPCLLEDGTAPEGDPCWTDIAFRDPALGPPTTAHAHD